MSQPVEIAPPHPWIQSVIYIAVGIAIMAVLYVAITRLTTNLRLRGIISRKAEGIVRVLTLTIAFIVVLSLILSQFLAGAVWVAATVMLVLVAVALIGLRSYLENLFGYIALIASGILKDGDRVAVEFDGFRYEGKVTIREGNYLVLTSEDRRVLYIPYSRLLKTVIIKSLQYVVQLRITVSAHSSGKGLELSELLNTVGDSIKRLSYVYADTMILRPVRIEEDKIVLDLEVALVAPRNVNQLLSELLRDLSKRIPHGVEIELVKE